MSDARALVTGASGFIGSHLVDALEAQGRDVVPVDRRPNPWSKEADEATIQVDLAEPGACQRLPTDVDAVFHLAANSRVRPTMADPRLARENLASTFELLEWAREHGVRRFVFASSREVYGNVASGAAGEDEADPRALANPYAASKLGCEALAHAWRNGFDLDVAVARLANVYGARDVSDRVVPIFVSRALAGLELEIYGEGKRLDLLHVDDCVEGLLALERELPGLAGESVNLGSGDPVGLERLAEAIVERTPNDVPVTHQPRRGGEVDAFQADIQLAAEALGWRPETSLQAGLDRTVGWYADEPEIRSAILEGNPREALGEGSGPQVG